jgi:hypothetical protein
MANNEDSNCAHEECYCRQRKNMVSDIPSGNKSVSYLLVWQQIDIHLPKVPVLHIIVAFFRRKRIALKFTTRVKL